MSRSFYSLTRFFCLITVLVAVAAVLPLYAQDTPAASPATPVAADAPVATPVTLASEEGKLATVQSTWLGQIFGWGMSPLWICSVILLALIFERFAALRYRWVMDDQMAAEVESSLARADISAAAAASEKSASVLGKAWTRAFQEFSLGGATLADSLDTYTALSLKPLRKNLAAISTLAVISPSFGLLGTIIGMIIVFGQIELTGGADKSQLAGGIALALFTTAGGLIVSIPAVIAGRFFRARLQSFSDQAEALNNRISFRYVHAVAAREAAAGEGEGECEGECEKTGGKADE